MESHEAANAFPMMTDERYQQLKQDIATNGLREPITVHDGKILDGRNRYRACSELGVGIQCRQYDGNPWAYVWSLNGERRDLVDEQRYLIWRMCSEHSADWEQERARIASEANRKRAEAADARRRPDGTLGEKPVLQQSVVALNDHRRGQASRAAASHTNRGAVARGEKLLAANPDLAMAVAMGEVRPSDAHKKIRQDAHQKKLQAVDVSSPVRFTLTADQSVVLCSVLITDPPYGILDEQWEPDDLESFTREWASRWNECGAELALIFFSQRHLFDGRTWFDAALTNYRFQQLLVWNCPNNMKPQSRSGYKQSWEPILFYRRADSTRQISVNAGSWGGDLHDFDCHRESVPSQNHNGVDNKIHPAQKPLSVMRWLVATASRPGDLVVDPFCGSGTTGIAAVQLGRLFHGIETDNSMRDTADRRIRLYGQPE